MRPETAMSSRIAFDARRVFLHADAVVLAPAAVPVTDSFQAGEIVGLAGLEGHGQDAFLEALAGFRRPLSGGVRSAGGAQISDPVTAARHGIAYVPRDRRSTGIFPTLSVIDNFAIASVTADVRGGLIGLTARRTRFRSWKERLGIIAASDSTRITALSGGNQQKVLLARALALEPSVLLLNDPTRGVDIRTRHTLYDVFRGMAKDGMALVVLSTEIEEILRLCHRLLVFRSGTVSARMAAEALSVDRVLGAMFGAVA